MSCSTTNTQPSLLTVSMGALPEGFCGTPQQLANAIAARLIVQISQNNGLFVTGSTAPTSNVGPWWKDCTEWWTWSDSLGKYIPVTKGGYTTLTVLTGSGNYVVPANIYRLRISAWGAGGGGITYNGSAGGNGGGGGGYCQYDVAVVPAQVIPYVCGVGGVIGAVASNGGDTTILALTAGGGKGGVPQAGTNTGGLGGTASGGVVNIIGQSGGTNALASAGVGGNSPRGGNGGVPDRTNQASSINGQLPGGGGTGAVSAGILGGGGGNGMITIEY